MHISTVYVLIIRWLIAMDQCQVVFPFTNSLGHPYMATGKNHSIKVTPEDTLRYCDAINVSCEAPETEHKNWVKDFKRSKVTASTKGLRFR
jgi:hypothetical protein